jgi:hypothetical protein
VLIWQIIKLQVLQTFIKVAFYRSRQHAKNPAPHREALGIKPAKPYSYYPT